MSSLARVAALSRADAAAASVPHCGSPAEGRATTRARAAQSTYFRFAIARPDFGPRAGLLGYIIGTRFVFDALDTYPEIAPEIASFRDAAARTLVSCQNADGGFGESPDSDTKSRFTPSASSAALVTAAALGILQDSKVPQAQRASASALQFILRTQQADGTWPELSLCTQFSGLYASYELMTQVALTTTLFRIVRANASRAK